MMEDDDGMRGRRLIDRLTDRRDNANRHSDTGRKKKEKETSIE